jgi:Rad3-related DNA helicase
MNWKENFPKPHKPRPIQTQAIDFALDAFVNKKQKYVILELPTGVGKSFIAATIASYFHKVNKDWKSYIISTQIILQDQYKKEFPHFANISASGNYTCNIFKDSSCA